MNTETVLTILTRHIPQGTSLISSLGRTSEVVFSNLPNQTLFLDSMGDVSTIACGIALGLGKSNSVVALDTDGSHLMGLSLLPTIATLSSQVPNLLLIVLDNGIYESAGGLPSRDSNVDWQLLGKAWNLDIQVISSEEDLIFALEGAFTKFLYLVIKIENLPDSSESQKSLDGIESKYRFCRHLENVLDKQLLRPAVKS